jgi:tetratricopeptide (TPR) repeat protein
MPGRVDLLVMLGAACVNLGGWLERSQGDAAAAYREAVGSFEAVVKQQPGSAEGWNHLGTARRALAALEKTPERWKSAREAFERALKLQPAWKGTLEPAIEECRRGEK